MATTGTSATVAASTPAIPPATGAAAPPPTSSPSAESPPSPPEPVIDEEQILQDFRKEKEKLLTENRLLRDHLTMVAERTSSQLEEVSRSGDTDVDDEEIPEYGSRSSLTKSSFIGGDSDFTQEDPAFKSDVEEEHKDDDSDEYESNIASLLLPKLNAEEKNDIASKENAGLHQQMENCRSENERKLDELRAAYDEAELRVGEVRRDRADFQRDVMGDAQNKGFKRANAHKVLKFLESKIRDKVAKAKKVYERNQALHVVIARTVKQLSMKKELADVLHAVDFEQLHIHKQQNQQKLQDKNHELQRIKSSLAKASDALEVTSRQLTNVINNRNRTKEDLSGREPQLAHVKKDIERVSAKKERLEELFHIFVQERDAQLGESQPNVLDYMQLKAKVYNLRQEYKTWTQKVEVAELCSRHASTHQSEKDSVSVADGMVPYKSS